MNCLKSFILAILLIAICSALPQWQPTNVNRFDNTGFQFSKDYNFKGKSSIGGIGGYDRQAGIGLGLQSSHNFNQGTGLSASLYKTQNGGTQKNFDLSHQFKQGTSLFGSKSFAPNFKSTTFGAGHDFGQGTSLYGSQTNSNYGGYKVKQHDIELSHQFKSGGSLNVFGGKNSHSGTHGGIGFKFPFGKKK